MPKMINVKPRKFGISEFRQLLDLVVLSNTLADKLSKTNDYDALFGGELKRSSKNFAKKLEVAMKKVMEESETFSEEHYDIFRNIEEALESFMNMSIEGRLAQQIEAEKLKGLEEKAVKTA